MTINKKRLVYKKLNRSLLISTLLLILFPFILYFFENLLKEKTLGQYISKIYVLPWQQEIKKAQNEYELQNFQKAEDGLETLVQTIPCNQIDCRLFKEKVNTLLLLSQVYEKQGNLSKAIEIIEELNSFVPKNYQYYYLQSKLEFKLANYENAILLTEKSLENYPQYLPAIELKILSLINLKKYPKALVVHEEYANNPLIFSNEIITGPLMRIEFSKEMLDLIEKAKILNKKQ